MFGSPTRVPPFVGQRSLVSTSFLAALAGLASGCLGVVASPPASDSEGPADSPGVSGGAQPGSSAGAGAGAGAAPGTDPAAPAAPGEAAGPAPLRRLSPSEYNHTVRDLLGVDPAVGDDFGIDRDAALSGFARGGPVSSGADARQVFETTERLAVAALPAVSTLLPCKSPTTPAEETACASTFIARFGRRAFRRPLDDDEVSRLLAVFSAHRGPDIAYDFPASIGAVVTAMLQSPNFLYRWELGPAAPIRECRLVRFNSYEIASRLSYLFWASMPDDRLFDLADKGQLATREQITTEARRLLADPKARDGVVDFHLQWLDVEDLPLQQKDPALSNYSNAVAQAMLEETRRFVTDLFHGPEASGSFETLLTSRKTFVDAGLAKLYGLPAMSGSGFAPVTLDATQRAGILTEAGFLAAHATPAESHPVRRGVAMLKRILCIDIDPPKDMDVPPAQPPAPGLTTRERFAMHAMNPCASCHRLMDPIGFAFENYDAIGAFRSEERGKPVDASGTLSLGGKDVAFKNAVELTAALAQAPEVRSCMAAQWLRYLLRRREQAGELDDLLARQAAVSAGGAWDLRELLVAVTGTSAFTHRLPSPGEVMP